LQSALSVPLLGRDGVAGVLALYLREKQGFTKDHLRLLLAASSKLGLSVENAMQYERAQDSASKDFLTGLPNAREVCLTLEQEIVRARRKENVLAVLLCDLNGFKKVNDNSGHLVGNRLLQEIAKNLKATCREYDQVGRLGGDEFVFILPELTSESIEDLKARLSLSIEDASRLVCPDNIVTASIGCAFYPKDGSTAEELLAEADRHMYECKEAHYKRSGPSARTSNQDADPLVSEAH